MKTSKNMNLRRTRLSKKLALWGSSLLLFLFLLAPGRLLQALSTHTPTPIPAAGNGLCMQVWSNTNLSGAIGLTLTGQNVAYNWSGTGSGSPGGSIPTTNWSAQWTGNILIPQPGSYTFSTCSDDGCNLWIDGTQIINDWTAQSATTETATANYTAGEHTITLQYFQDGGFDLMFLYWSFNGGATTVIPTSDFYNTSCSGPTPTFSPTAGGGAGTKTPTPTGGGLSTPTPTVTPTLTTTPFYQGLSQTAWLTGLEYIPFPVENQGANVFYDLSMTFTTAANNAVPKNTMRYRIVLQNIATTSSLTSLSQIGVETRIGENGVTCTSGYNDPALYIASGANTFSPPTDPCNISSTYFWVDSQVVPYTEQFDAMGDPREVPYRDMMGLPAGEPFANNYNWFWMNMGDNSQPDYANNQHYAPFIPDAQFSTYNGGPYVDVPKLFTLWRKAITHSQSVYTGMAGWDSYYIGIGGELGGDTSNNMNNGVLCNEGPWGGPTSSSYHYNEIFPSEFSPRQNPDGYTLVADNKSPHQWFCRPWIGELYPDNAYWSNWYNASTASTAVGGSGNLNNQANGGVWERVGRDTCGASAGNNQWNLIQSQAANQANGCATFQNGGGSSGTFDHTSDNINATTAYDGTVMSSDYNFAVDSPFAVSRPWGLNLGGNTPQEWSMAPYSNERASLSVYSCTTQSTSTWGFYNYDNSNDSVNDKSSATIRNYIAADNSVGWYIVNGLAPATQSGIDFLAQFALLTCIRTFHDAGTPTLTASGASWAQGAINTSGGITYRIAQIPYINITLPAVGQDVLADPVIVLNWVERSARWDDHRYTENYPCLDNAFGYSDAGNSPCAPGNPTAPDNPNNEWHDSQPLTYNLKYSTNNGATWFSVVNPGETVTAGTLVGGSDALTFPTGQWTHTYNWTVSSLPVGYKILRVEAYRTNYGLHYGYNTIQLNTQ